MSKSPPSQPVAGKFPLYAITIYFVLTRCLKELGQTGDEIPQNGWSVPLYQGILIRLPALPGIEAFKSTPRTRTQYLQALALEVRKALAAKQPYTLVKVEMLYFIPLMRFCGIGTDHISLNGLFQPESPEPRFKLRVQSDSIYTHFNVQPDELSAPDPAPPTTAALAKPPVFLLQYNLPIRPPFFVGREQLLALLHERFANGRDRILLVHGIGGMGKTTLMQEYLYRPACRHHFERVIYAAVNKGLEEAFVRTAGLALGLDEQRKQLLTAAAQLEFMTGELSRFSGNNLFVIDNVNEKDYQDLKRLRPCFEQAGWSFLITTRTRPDGFEGIDVDELEEEEAEHLFLHHYLENDRLITEPRNETFDRDLSALLVHIIRHTLMIEILAKAALKKDLSLADLLQRLRERDFRHPDLQRTVTTAHGRERLTTAAVHEYMLDLFDTEYLQRPTGDVQLDRENEAQITMLRFFSVLPALEIPLADLEYLWDIVADEQITFGNRLDDLRQIGWLQCKRLRLSDIQAIRQTTYKMHQLIQEVVYEKLQPDADNCMRLVIKISQILGEMPDDPRPYHRYARSIYDKLKALITERPQLRKNG